MFTFNTYSSALSFAGEYILVTFQHFSDKFQIRDTGCSDCNRYSLLATSSAELSASHSLTANESVTYSLVSTQ